MGKANRLIGKLARVVCLGFPGKAISDQRSADRKSDSDRWSLRSARSVFTGNPIRPDITRGSRDAGMRITRFSGNRPVLMVIGGSQGSLILNEAVQEQFDRLISCCDIIHITGQGKKLNITPHARYFSREFVVEELPHLYALSDIVVTRAGAGALSEIAACKKAMIVVPLPGVAHDHQIKNAVSIAEKKAAVLFLQNQLQDLSVAVRALVDLPLRRAEIAAAAAQFFPHDAAQRIADIIVQHRKSA